MVTTPTLREMLEAGVHFGHKTSRWHPKMDKFIFGAKSGVHVIDLEKTQSQLSDAMNFLAEAAKEGKTVLFVGTKKQAQEIVKKGAQDCGMPYIVSRWLGGMLTNFNTVQKAFKKLERARLIVSSPEFAEMKKRDKVKLTKEIEKGERLVGGLVGLSKQPDVIILVGVHDEKNAIKEATQSGVTTIGIVDTNADPNLVDYPIPANDDATKSIALFVNLFAKTIKENKGAVANDKN
ncbi:MAG: 30S ribosomal protein S2 [Patescibacteria group bacterium]|jgi:small subunit ribosomal protein S2